MASLQSLQKEVDDLKKRNRVLDKRLNAVEENLNISKEEPEEEKEKKTTKVSFEADVGLKWFGRIGILALVIGIGYFIKYALDQGWINHLTQIIIATVFGLALIIVGEIISKKEKYIAWAQTLMGGGFAIIYFVVYAAYHFESYRDAIGISQTLDIILLSIVVSMAILVSIKHNSKIIFGGAFFLGFVNSLLSKNFDILTLTYCLILTIGLVIVVSYKQWYVMGILGLIGTYLTFSVWYVSNWIDNTSASFWLTTGFLLIYFVAYTLQSLILKPDKENQSAGVITTLINSFFFLLLYLIEIRRVYPAYDWLFTLGLTLFSLIIFFIAKMLQKDKLSVTNLYLSVGYLSLTIPLYFNHQWITIIWAIETIILTILAFEFDIKPIKIMSYVVGIITGLKTLTFDSWDLKPLDFSSLATSTRFFAFLATIIAFYVVTIYLEKKKIEKNEKFAPNLYSWLAAVIAVVLIMLEFKEFWITVWWAVIASLILVAGFGFKKRYLRLQGIILFGLVIIKVFLYDTRELEIIYRTISFILLGILLLSASFIYTKFKERIKDVF